MRVVITDDAMTIEDAPNLGIAALDAEDQAKVTFLQAFSFALTRLNEELGLIAARGDALVAINAAAKREKRIRPECIDCVMDGMTHVITHVRGCPNGDKGK